MDNNIELMRAIYQCVSDSFHGSEQENYMDLDDSKAIGLNREKKITSAGYPIKGIDDFNVRIYSNGVMCIHYSADMNLKDAHSPSFANEVEFKFKQIMDHLHKQYRNKNSKQLRTKDLGEADIDIQTLSRTRSWIKAKKHYQLLSHKAKPVSTERNDRFKDLVDKFKDEKFK